MTRLLPSLVGAAGALAAAAVVFGVETHLFPGAEALVGILGALTLGYVAKGLTALDFKRPAPPTEPSDDG